MILGAAAIVLIAITLWIVWPTSNTPPSGGTVRATDGQDMMPLGDEFEDQYTSATGDLSAGGVATALASETATDQPVSEAPVVTAARRAPEPAAVSRQNVSESDRTPPLVDREERAHQERVSRSVSVAAAALVTLAGAICGGLAYSRWQRQRRRPLNRFKRALFRS